MRIAAGIFAFSIMVAMIPAVLETDEECSLSAVMDCEIALPEISAQTACVIDGEGNVLMEKGGEEKTYPASTTKILTCITAIEIMEELESDINQLVKIPEKACGIEGSSIYLKPGEEISLKDLFYAMMLRSGNDAAAAVAVITGGSEKNFVRIMNEKADEAGCTGSNFENPTGLFDENHYTTAKDMCRISLYAMKNPTFREIAGALEYTAKRQAFAVTENGGKEYIDYRMKNKNRAVREYEGATGIKIGYTEKSGRTLCASAQRGNHQVIAAVMNAPDWFSDSYHLMDYGFGLLGEE